MKNRKVRDSILILVMITLLSLAPAAFAGTYWVSPNGTASWANCEGATPLNGASCCPLTTANSYALAGDIVNLRAGTYNDHIEPANSGTAWSNQIIFSAYNNEVVTVDTAPGGLNRTMALNSGWNNYGAPTTNERSSAQAFQGNGAKDTFSRKFIVDAANEGIQSDVFTTDGVMYAVAFWVYSDQSSIHITVYNGASTVIDTDISITPNRWVAIGQYPHYTFTGSTSGSYIRFNSPGYVSSGTWYIDNVRIGKVGGGIDLNGNDYIKVHGITFKNSGRAFEMHNGSDYNEISNCTFTDSITAYEYAAAEISNDGGTASTNNWIHGSTFYNFGYTQANTSDYDCDDISDTIHIGGGQVDPSSYNLIENCVFYAGSHAIVNVRTKNNTIRNNVFHNEGWITVHPQSCVSSIGDGVPNNPDAGFGNRNLHFENPGGSGGYNLVEGNRIGYAGTPPDDDGSHGIANPVDNNITRYNFIYGNGGSGIYFKPLGGYPDNNRVYNNTIYNNGGGDDIHPLKQAGISYGSCSASGNVIKNNIVYDNTTDDIKDCSGNTTTNNWLTTDGDPSFVNPDMSDKTSLTLPDLSLQSGSGARDQGVALTTVDNSDNGTGTSLIVADASYFQDGSWAPSGKIDADWIAVGSVGNIVQISSINYSTNTITLSSAISRNEGDNVWLYKDSAGNIVLSGSAPDIGAYEYIATDPDSSPPSLSNGSPSGTLSSETTSVTIGLTTNEPATCKYSRTQDVTYASMTNTFSATGGTSHSTPISGLSDGNSYSFYVRCQDASDNANASDYIISFSVAVTDSSLPTIPDNLLASPISSSQINLSWTASTDNVGVTGYQIYRDGVQVDTSPVNSYSDTGLSPSTTYTYTVSAYDAAGNESSQSSSASAATLEASSVTEAEPGNLTSPMQIVSDVEASGGAYIQTTQSDSGTAAYTFNIDESGVYNIIARVYALDGGSDSFYVKIDDGEEFVWHLNPSQNPDEFNVWREDEVNNQGTGTHDNPQYDPYTVKLTRGAHTITFRGRETNSRLDYFYFSKEKGSVLPPTPANLRLN